MVEFTALIAAIDVWCEKGQLNYNTTQIDNIL